MLEGIYCKLLNINFFYYYSRKEYRGRKLFRIVEGRTKSNIGVKINYN